MSIARTLVNDFAHEAALTRKLLAAVPEDRLGWKPHDKSMTLGALAGHLAETPGWCGAMLEPEFDFAASGADWKPFVPASRKELLDKHDHSAQGFAPLFADRDDAFMRQTWTMRNGATVMLSEPRDAAARMFAIHHSIHHRGQLTVYLRLLGVPVPSTYGPSADDAG
jgi:uncharacterized damage-inducible protein DinB